MTLKSTFYHELDTSVYSVKVYAQYTTSLKKGFQLTFINPKNAVKKMHKLPQINNFRLLQIRVHQIED